jgi:hypothetical protein
MVFPSNVVERRMTINGARGCTRDIVPRATGIMRLDARAFGTAAGMIAAALFTICALAVAVAPEQTTVLAGYLVHMNLSGMARTVTLGSFVGGLIIGTLGTAIAFGSTAAIYNRLAGRVRAPADSCYRSLTQGTQF